MTELPRKIRLAPGDYFMHAQDLWMRRSGLQGNICCAVLEMDKGFDAERLRRRVAESPLMNWLARARMKHPVPFLPPTWQLAKAEPIFFEHAEMVPYRGVVEMQYLRELLGVSRLLSDRLEHQYTRFCPGASDEQPPKKPLECIHERM